MDLHLFVFSGVLFFFLIEVRVHAAGRNLEREGGRVPDRRLPWAPPVIVRSSSSATQKLTENLSVRVHHHSDDVCWSVGVLWTNDEILSSVGRQSMESRGEGHVALIPRSQLCVRDFLEMLRRAWMVFGVDSRNRHCKRCQILLFGFRLFPFGSTAPLASRTRSHQFSFDISMLALKVEIGS